MLSTRKAHLYNLWLCVMAVYSHFSVIIRSAVWCRIGKCDDVHLNLASSHTILSLDDRTSSFLKSFQWIWLKLGIKIEWKKIKWMNKLWVSICLAFGSFHWIWTAVRKNWKTQASVLNSSNSQCIESNRFRLEMYLLNGWHRHTAFIKNSRVTVGLVSAGNTTVTLEIAFTFRVRRL